MTIQFGGPQIEVGRIVIWTSQSQGRRKWKNGTVLLIVPAGKSVHDVHVPNVGRYDMHNIDTAGGSRGHESYIVMVERKNRKPMLYWPRTKFLKVV